MRRVVRLLIAILVFAPIFGGAENFTPRTFHVLAMEAIEPVKAVLQLGDAVQILLPQERNQLLFLEVEIKIPAIIAANKDSAAFCFYSDVRYQGDNDADSPLLETGSVNVPLQGKRLYYAPFPGRVGLNLALPYANYVLSPTPYLQVVPVTADETTATLFLHLENTNPTLTQEAQDALFYVTLRPHIENRGFLELIIRYPQGQNAPYSLFIDEKSAAPGRIALESGSHHLSVVSDFFRNEMRTFVIERGKTNHLEVELRDISPTLVIVAPDNVEVFLDDRPLLPGKPGTGNTPLALVPGDHLLRVNISGYEMLRTFHAENGRSYNITIRLDLDIQEIR
jgi:hypothetical protein